MPWVYIICFALIAAGLLTLFGVRPGDFIDALFRSQRKSATLTDELNVLMGTPAKGFFNQDFELKQILKGTGRADRYEAVKRLTLILFAVGGALALLIGNVYMVPILPLLYFLNEDWFHTLLFTTPGKIALAICAAIILFALTQIMKLSRPIEYGGDSA